MTITCNSDVPRNAVLTLKTYKIVSRCLDVR